MKTSQLSNDQLLAAYHAGKWVPSSYGASKFTVANKVMKTECVVPAHTIAGRHYPQNTFMCEMDLAFISRTIQEAQDECDRRNFFLEPTDASEYEAREEIPQPFREVVF